MKIVDALKHGYFETRNTLYPEYQTRGFVRQLKNEYNGKSLVGAEIGTHMGYHALMLLYHNNIDRLYLIDPYESYDDYELPYEGKKDLRIHNDETHHDAFIFANKLLKKYKDRIVFVKKYAVDAVDFIPGGLDFTYLDDNHTYKFVKQNTELYYTKVRDGGIFGGHDFSPGYGVPYAVLEFAEENGLLEKLGGGKLDWWIKK